MVKFKMRDVRDIFVGLQLLTKEPIATHVLSFRIKTAIQGLQPLMETYTKTELEILKSACELDDTGEAKRDERGMPVWLEPRAENERNATKVLSDILEEQVDLPPNVKPLTWDVLEKATCAYSDKDGRRFFGPLAISAEIQLFLGSFLTGEPSA